jgi:hypothetical protein
LSINAKVGWEHTQWLAAAVLDRSAGVHVCMDVLVIDGLYQPA